MNRIAVRNIERASAEIIEGLAKVGVSTAHEALGRMGLMHTGIGPRQQGARIAGSAVTALCAPGDNFMLHVALELLHPGDILVVATLSPSTDGYIGDLLVTAAKARGAVAMVLDAGIRDVAEIREMQFPVWSRCVSAQGTVKETVVSANVPVTCGGAYVVPGDIIVADDDGVVVIPRLQGAGVLEAARRREQDEVSTRARLNKGEVTLDVLNLRSKLSDRGLRYVDGPVDWSGGDKEI